MTAILLIGAARPAQADVLTVTAKGIIEPVCSISANRPFPAADFSARGHVTGSAVVDCNTGFVITANSANGAVTNPAAVSSGFVNRLNYMLHMRVPLDGGVLAAQCDSSTLVAGQSSCSLSPAGPGLNSGGQTGIRKSVNMTLSWFVPPKARPVAGAYHDTLTISVAAAP